jgi:type I restriction enzyme S subunit
VKAGWRFASLGDVCVKTQTVDPTKWPDRIFSYIDVSSVSNKTFGIDQVNELVGRDAPSRARKRIEAEDVIFATVRPTLMRVAQVPTDLHGQVCSTGYVVLRPDGELDARFLYYSLFRSEFRETMEHLQAGASYPAVTDRQVLQQQIPLPPLFEQKGIVAVLDQAFAALDRARAHAEANMADAEGLLENALDQVFRDLASSSPVVPLEEAVHPECKLSYGIVQPGDLVEGGLPIVRPVDLKQRVITLAGLKSIAPTLADGYARTKLVGGELLLCVRGSTGEISIAAPELAGGNVTRGIVPIRFEMDKVLPEFAYFQFLSRYARDQIAAKTYGAALMQINIKDLRQLNFVLPHISLQSEIVGRAEELYERAKKLTAAYVQKLADIANLRQSLLQKAFSGELT